MNAFLETLGIFSAPRRYTACMEIIALDPEDPLETVLDAARDVLSCAEGILFWGPMRLPDGDAVLGMLVPDDGGKVYSPLALRHTARGGQIEDLTAAFEKAERDYAQCLAARQKESGA